MATRDLYHSIKVIDSYIAGAAESAVTANKGGANTVGDTFGYESITFVGRAQTLTAGTLTIAAQDSADGTTWGALTDLTLCIAAAQCIGTVAGTQSPTALAAAGAVAMGIMDTRRYVRIIMVEAGYSGIMSGDIILGHPHHRSAAV